MRLFEWKKEKPEGIERLDKMEKIENTSIELIDELKDVKKILRKQGILIEAFKADVIGRIDKKEVKELQPYVEIADNYFHLISSFKQREELSPGHTEAVEIVWQKLESLLSFAGLEIIRQDGLPFDPKIHEAVERMPGQHGNPVVLKIYQPGFIYMGNVIRPAKVIIGDKPVIDEKPTIDDKPVNDDNGLHRTNKQTSYIKWFLLFLTFGIFFIIKMIKGLTIFLQQNSDNPIDDVKPVTDDNPIDDVKPVIDDSYKDEDEDKGENRE